MDITTVLTKTFGTLFSTYWWLIPLLFLITIFKTPFMKGVLGELIVNLASKFFLDKEKYHLFKNVTLPTEDGTTQIDHVIVSRYGLFVIETKNMKGWIFGNPQQKTWTQKIYKHTSKFQNPLHQNYKHTQTLQSALEIESNKIFSLVVFVGDSDFKTPMPENVVYAGGYIRFIKSKVQPVLTDSRQMRSSWHHEDYVGIDPEHDDRGWTQSNVTMKLLMHRSLSAFFEYGQGVYFAYSVIGY